MDTKIENTKGASNELYKLLSTAFQDDNSIETVILIDAKNENDFWCKTNILTKKTGININDFEAHAWVKSEGRVLNDQDDVATRFNPFPIPYGLLK